MIDLLDARGYEIKLATNSNNSVNIKFLGAWETEHEELKFDEDAYVVSRVENQEFRNNYSVVLKDTGIRKSGLKLLLEAEEGTDITVTICNHEIETYHVNSEKKVETVLDVTGLCKSERDYLDNVHRILYLLLSEVDRICKQHDIHYFLVFGGLLGVYRYGDIIPWDDDIDIAMTRADFERFKQVAPKELGSDFMYLDCAKLGGAFLDYMCRLLYVKETVPINVFRKVSGKCRPELENHLPLDIFILDKASDSPFAHKFQMLLVRGVYGLGMGHRAYLNKKEYENRDKKTRISVAVLSTLGKILPLRFIFWLHNRISMMYEKKETKDYFMSNGFLPFIHTKYSREWFETCTEVKLGTMKVSAPADIEAYLKRAYYDYYHFPPVNKRIPEHSPDANGVF